MPDVYAAITDAEPAVLEQLATVLELRAADAQPGRFFQRPPQRQIERFQAHQGLVQLEQAEPLVARRAGLGFLVAGVLPHRIQALVDDAHAALGGIAAARMVDQDAPHQGGHPAEELAARRPAHAALLAQPHEGLVHEGGALQHVVVALGPHVPPGHPAQVAVDQRDQPLQRLVLPLRPGVQ